MRPAAELLLIESRSLPAIVSEQSPDALDRDTALPGWRVRDVIAHCGAALRRLVDGEVLDFSAEANQADVDERKSWPISRVLTELFEAYPAAAGAIDAAGGVFDGLGLGEWIHGGDIRDPLGVPDAYAGPGIEIALPLLVSRSMERETTPLRVEAGDLRFVVGVGEPVGELRTDLATFVRLCAGRAPDPDRFELTGASAQALLLFS